MKKSLAILGLALMGAAQLQAQQNPAVANPWLSVAPVANVGSQFDISFNVGNSGTVAISGANLTQQMSFTISLGKCKPSFNNTISTIGTNALSGAALNSFNVTYDANLNMFFGTQKPGVAINFLTLQTIMVHVQVTQLSATATTNDIGGTLNVQPNPASNGTGGNVTSDDEANIFTHTTGAPLPVVLNQFDAQANGCAVSLKWSTADELNFDYFIIERGVDKDYKGIAKVSAKGDNSVYEQNDATPISGLNTYRLKMVDKDGMFTYSPIASANINCTPNSDAIIVYPNPAKNLVNVSGVSIGATVRITDITGRTVAEQISTGESLQMDIAKLPAAMYNVTVIKNGAATASIKVSKQ